MRFLWIWLLAAIPPQPKYDLIIVCERGAVVARESYLASGTVCFLADKHGSKTSAQTISIYDDSRSPGP